MSALDPNYHEQLIKSMAHIVKQSNIPEYYIRNSALGYCDKQDITFLTQYPTLRINNAANYCKIASQNHLIKMQFMAGALIRNFIDARCFSLDYCINDLDTQPTALFIPDFCLDTTDGKPIVSWRVQQAYDLLVKRAGANQATIIYCESMTLVKKQYGNSIFDFIKANYIQG